MNASKLDKLRLYALNELGFNTNIKAEFVDETMFLGHRLTLNNSSLENMTQLSTVIPKYDDLAEVLYKFLQVCEILHDSWMESEVVFKNQGNHALLLPENPTHELPTCTSIEEVQMAMVKNGWTYSDQMSAGSSGSRDLRRYMFLRDNWHGRDLVSPVEFFFSHSVSESENGLLDKVIKTAETALQAWHDMPEQVPSQNMFGQVQVDKVSTEYAFKAQNQANPRFRLED